MTRFTQPPIIIGGCGRSGTTLWLSMLSAHPHIYGIAEESWAFWPTETDDEFRTLIEKFEKNLESHDPPPSCTRWCEKTPKNVTVFGQLLKGFGPDIRLIHIIRDGRDVITSVHPHDPDRYWVSWWRWVEDVEAGLAFHDHPQVFTVRYEDLVRSYERTMRSICEFIEEEFDQHLLRWCENTTVRTNAAWTGEVQPIFDSSIGKWTQPQHAAVVAGFMQQESAVNLLQRLGYLSHSASCS